MSDANKPTMKKEKPAMKEGKPVSKKKKNRKDVLAEVSEKGYTTTKDTFARKREED